MILPQRGLFWAEYFAQDVRYAARALCNSLGFTYSVVATLAIAIGLVTAVVNVSQPILLPELPFPEPGRVMVLNMRSDQGDYSSATRGQFVAFARRATSFSAFGAEERGTLNLMVGREPHAVSAASVTRGFFAALGAAGEMGRLFLPEDYEAAHAGENMVVSYRVWQSLFGGDPALVGRDVRLGDRLRRVIGILPPRFMSAPWESDARGEGVYLAAPEHPVGTSEISYALNVVGRLKPGVSREQAEAELATIEPADTRPNSREAPRKPWLLSAPDAFRHTRERPFQVFLGATGLLYLIGCTAVANLMLSRAVARRRELGVRLALGGSRRRLMALLLTESLLLAALSGVGGAAVAMWAQDLMRHLAPLGIEESDLLQHALSSRTFAIALGLGLMTCLGCCLLSVSRVSSINVNEALKEGAGALGESRRLALLRAGFVVAEAAFASALLIGAGLLLCTVYKLQHIDVGFALEHKVVLTGLRVGGVDRNRIPALNLAVRERLAAVPGVAAATLTSTVPVAGFSSWHGLRLTTRMMPGTSRATNSASRRSISRWSVCRWSPDRASPACSQVVAASR